MKPWGVVVGVCGLFLTVAVAERSCGKIETQPKAESASQKPVYVPMKNFPDDVPAVDGDLDVGDRRVEVFNHMPEANYKLGNPNATWSFEDLSCKSQPIIVAGYKDLDGWDKNGNLIRGLDYLMEYRNLHCQPDERAHVLIGSHPEPGEFSTAMREQGVNLQLQ